MAKNEKNKHPGVPAYYWWQRIAFRFYLLTLAFRSWNGILDELEELTKGMVDRLKKEGITIKKEEQQEQK